MKKYHDYMDEITKHPERMEELGDIFEWAVNVICHLDHDEYIELMHKLHMLAFGPHFDTVSAHEAVAAMHNVDGSVGEHWSEEQTTAIANQQGLAVNLCDWYYLLNMLHSDYSNLWGEDINTYVRMARAYMDDPDADRGKVYKLWHYSHL